MLHVYHGIQCVYAVHISKYFVATVELRLISVNVEERGQERGEVRCEKEGDIRDGIREG